MMKSESEAALIGDTVPPYLRAYRSVYRSSRLGQQYESIGHGGDGEQQQGQRKPGGGVAGLFVLRRAFGALAVFVGFAVAVSSTSARWPAGQWGPAGPGQGLQGVSYREMFDEAIDVGTWTASEPLILTVTNEYGHFDRRALSLYNLDIVIEPYRETRITVMHQDASTSRFQWLLIQSDGAGVPLDGVEPIIEAKGGEFATVMLTEGGKSYALLVKQLAPDGSDLAVRRATISCKYVRRELRELTEEDRSAFFAAMQEFYMVPLAEGQEKYGSDFVNAKIVAAVHNSQEYCFHNGIHFLNAHAAFDLWVERMLQMIDPSVSLAYWDFMVEASTFGTSWPESEIFGPEMFGSARGSSDNHFQIADGWFANITSAYDPDHTLVGERLDTSHNPYGLVDAPYNFQNLPGVIRTHSYCGLGGESKFTKCDTFIDCFEDYDNLYDWARCMELEVHAGIHGMIGGGFNCNVDMALFHEEHPEYSQELLTFALEFLLANRWPANMLMSDYNTCDESCESGQTEPCGCTCHIDPFDFTDDEVYDVMEASAIALLHRFGGDKYMHQDLTVQNSIGFAQDGERVSEEMTMLLYRQMMKIGCEPGAVGAMSTGSSPLDPIFWVLHPAFEKGNHILDLAAGYRDTYGFEWVDADCGAKLGGKITDTFPFTEQMLGFGNESEHLTNAELNVLLHPSNPRLPYLFHGFDDWGDCTDWDPCPECSVFPDDSS